MYSSDCPECRECGRSNLTVTYGRKPASTQDMPGVAGGMSMWRYDAMLPVARADSVSLGEGGTALVSLPSLASKLNIASVYGKDESRNPTGSFKDRLASSAVSAARAMGARVIASSSSGNAGASAAAYAARAGMPCIVFTFEGTVGAMVTQMRAYGALVISTRIKTDRWRFLEHGVRELGWFPTSPFFGPAVGSNPLGIEGYKTIAYEIAEALDWRVPEWCVLPVCYGDALIGMWKGFQEMLSWGWIDRVPRMVAAEIYGSFGARPRGGAPRGGLRGRGCGCVWRAGQYAGAGGGWRRAPRRARRNGRDARSDAPRPRPGAIRHRRVGPAGRGARDRSNADGWARSRSAVRCRHVRRANAR